MRWPTGGWGPVVVLAAVVVLLGTACEVRANIDITAAADGSGEVAVAVGLDPGALERLGDPADALAVDDLVAAGWELPPPATDANGWTWLAATRSFADPAEFTTVLNEVAGPDGPLAGSTLTVSPGPFTTATVLDGVVDLTGGLAFLSDPELDEATDGIPLGGLVATLEAEQGRPVADMVAVTVTFALADQQTVVRPELGASPITAQLETSRVAIAWWVWALAGVVLAVVAASVVAVARRRP